MRKLTSLAVSIAVAATLILGAGNAAAFSSFGGVKSAFNPSAYQTAYGYTASGASATKTTKTSVTPAEAFESAATALKTTTSVLGGGTLGASVEPGSLTKLSGENNYNDSSSFEFLASPGKIVPGGKILTQQGRTCSVGYVVSHNGTDSILTAGHCGPIGTVFGYLDKNRKWKRIGTIVEGRNDSEKDWSIIKLDGAAEMQTDLPINNITVSKDVMSSDEAASADAICKLGHVTGLSCGKFSHNSPSGRLVFYGNASNGDSGGTVFALKDMKLRPVGILEGGYSGSNSLAVQPLESIQDASGISLQ